MVKYNYFKKINSKIFLITGLILVLLFFSFYAYINYHINKEAFKKKENYEQLKLTPLSSTDKIAIERRYIDLQEFRNNKELQDYLLQEKIELKLQQEAEERKIFNKDQVEAFDILKSVLITNTNKGFYITFKNHLLDGKSINNLVDINVLLKPISHTTSFTFKNNSENIVQYDEKKEIRVNSINPDGKYIRGLEENITYKVIVYATTHSGVKLEKSFLLEKKPVRKNLEINTYDKYYKPIKKIINFNPEKTALLLIDFTIDKDDHHPRFHIVNESRKLGIPIFHYMHEFIASHGISEVLRPLGFSDIVMRDDATRVIEAAKIFNRNEDIDTILVMGYAGWACAMYTRHNAITYLRDIYPNKNILPVEEGINLQNASSVKWAISQFRSSTGTVNAIEVLKSMNVKKNIIKNIEERYLNRFKWVANHEIIPIDSFEKKIESLDNKVLVISNFKDFPIKHLLKKQKIIELKRLFNKNNLPIIEIEENKLKLNDKIASVEEVIKFIEDRDLTPLITGYLKNENKIWRSGFPGDYYSQVYFPKLKVNSIFIRNLLYSKSLPPFSDFGFTSKDSIQILINLSSLYSSAGWIDYKEILKFR